MKRRTNLFYNGNNIDESNFLTFSNYTEHLTGVSLATNFKIFPSRFICLYVPKLSEDPSLKETFIKNYLVGYYENKLAILRDVCVNETESEKTGDSKSYPDRKLKYLGYLIDSIMKFDPETKMVYQSEITEQDYNGTFTDIILTIDSSQTFDKEYIIGEINTIDDSSDNKQEISDDSTKTYLYGWTEKLNDGTLRYIGPDSYKDAEIQFDGDDLYYYTAQHIYTMNEIKDYDKESSIKFNIVIPLYDIVNFDPSSNKIILCYDEIGLPILDGDNNLTYEESVKEYASLDHFDFNSVPKNDEHAVNVPYGIWFANETIELKRFNFNHYAPSWSLLIGTQFKPFPNSEHLVADNNSGSKMAGFATFAQILSRQTDILNSLVEYKSTIDTLKNTVEEQLGEIEGYKNLINELQSQLNTLTNNFNLHISNQIVHTKKDNVHKWISGN